MLRLSKTPLALVALLAALPPTARALTASEEALAKSATRAIRIAQPDGEVMTIPGLSGAALVKDIRERVEEAVLASRHGKLFKDVA